MARNGSGTWSAPAGQPVVAGTTIDPTAHNDLVADVGTEITDSLSRSGKGGMLAALKAVDGAVGAPGVAFVSEPSSGLYRAGAGDVRLGILGALVQKWIAAGIEITGTIKASLGLADDTSHGNRGGGALHADVVAGGASGFMTGADKTKLDDATAAATASKLVLRDANGRAAVATPSASGDIATKGYVDAPAVTVTTATMGTAWTGLTNSVAKSGATVTVALSVSADSGSAGFATIATLPVGCRPAETIWGPALVRDSSAATNFAARAFVESTGVVGLDFYDNGTALAVLFAIGAGDQVQTTITFVTA